MNNELPFIESKKRKRAFEKCFNSHGFQIFQFISNTSIQIFLMCKYITTFVIQVCDTSILRLSILSFIIGSQKKQRTDKYCSSNINIRQGQFNCTGRASQTIEDSIDPRITQYECRTISMERRFFKGGFTYLDTTRYSRQDESFSNRNDPMACLL